MRGGAPWLALEDLGYGARYSGTTPGFALVLSGCVSVFGALAGTHFGSAAFGWGEFDTRASGFRETDSDGLLRRPRAVLPAADLVNLLTHKLTRLCGGCLSRAPVSSGSLDCTLVWHFRAPISQLVLSGPGPAHSPLTADAAICSQTLTHALWLQTGLSFATGVALSPLAQPAEPAEVPQC
jgi:hypothetical protein